MKHRLIVLILLLGIAAIGYGQDFSDFPLPPAKYRNIYPAIINSQGDTIIQVYVKPIVIMPPPHFMTRQEWIHYWRLVYDVKAVYPYMKLINYYYYQVEATIQYMNPRERKRYIKEMEKYLRHRFEKELINNLTYEQGQLLIKLVDRETDHTTYDVIKQFRGTIHAQLWQAFARVFGSNLKVTYDKNKGDDRLIEYIIAQIDNGLL